ncbi:potassium-transporting ATPase subunit KdpC [Glaciihabitans sp. GrIS 2.15]|uniref:potassium-transporting ATPase subunit KdpC n=1 Tax=Glaciihabitans sp. GrIS 2.15 TaxID=3071710 RepID=UPI0019B0E398|nr:potassium-transporting ATPase subunit KdpC [Microbacteriaceae bacterium]MEC5170364.1 K+-transporting ATPase ATPase C chain [Glaciihabitans sp. GrIS 2.15]
MSSPRTAVRQYWVAIRAMLIFTVVLGVGYTAVITGIGQLALPYQANGSVITVGDATVGSALIGQGFTDKKGKALPQWFQSRPSAAGSGYDASASSGSNYGPENSDLITAVKERKAAIAQLDGVTSSSIPADALTASSSGLDPHISPEYALLQVERIARVRTLSVASVTKLVEDQIQAPDLGYLGQSRVNVLELNVALAKMKG